MASKKKTPAQIQLEKERREFVQARPNLEKQEARTRFYVQKRAAELEAAGKPVDRKALRQKYKSGGVTRAGFYTEGDLKRIAAQKAASNKGGTSGKGSNTTGQSKSVGDAKDRINRVVSPSAPTGVTGRVAEAKVWKPDAIQRTLDAATNPSNWLKWAKAGGSKALNFASREGESLQATFFNPAWNQTVGRINPKLRQREATGIEAVVNTASVVASILGTPAAGSTVKGLTAGGRSATTSAVSRLTQRSASKVDDIVKIRPGELGGVRFTSPKPVTTKASTAAKASTKKATTVITPTPVTRASTAGGIRGAAKGAKGVAAGAKGAAKGAKGAASGAKVAKVTMSGRRGAAAVAADVSKKAAKKVSKKAAKVEAKPAAQVIEKTVTKATPAPVKAAAKATSAPVKAATKKVAKKATAKKAVAKKAAAVKKEAAPKFEGMIYTGPRMSGNFLETTAKSSGSNMEMVSSDVINAMVQNQSKAMAKFVAEGGEEVVETVAKKAAAPRVVAKNVAKKSSTKTSRSTAKKAYDVKIGGQPKNIRTVEEATFKTTKELDKWISGGGKELLRQSDEVTRASFNKRNAKVIKELQETVSAQRKGSASAVMKSAKTMARYRRARPETQALYNKVVFARANRQETTVGLVRSTASKTKKK